MRTTPASNPRTRMPALLAALAMTIAAGTIHAQDIPASPRDYLARMDTNGDGRVSEAEYVAYMSQGFHRLDRNDDGVLEPDELPGGHGRPITLKQWQDDLRRQFHRLDRNHDGYLDAKELAAPPG